MTDPLLQDPFEYVRVFLGLAHAAEISFMPKASLPFAIPWTFTIQHCLVPSSTDGEWQDIGETTDNYSIWDMSRYTWDIIAESWYRVILTDGDNIDHVSRPTRAGNSFSRKDYLAARDICRRMYQQMRVHTGTEGYILRGKSWGEICPNCGNAITEQATNSQCLTCYGIGVIGGYYPAMEMTLETEPLTIHQAFRVQTGKEVLVGKQVLAVNFPPIRPKDIWIEKNSGRRWAVQDDIKSISSIRNTDLLVSFSIHEIETTDVVYHVPMPDEYLLECSLPAV